MKALPKKPSRPLIPRPASSTPTAEQRYAERSIAFSLVVMPQPIMNDQAPFACPVDCLFFEPRQISSAGWQRREVNDDDDEDE